MDWIRKIWLFYFSKNGINFQTLIVIESVYKFHRYLALQNLIISVNVLFFNIFSLASCTCKINNV